jgi:hypothetical protein
VIHPPPRWLSQVAADPDRAVADSDRVDAVRLVAVDRAAAEAEGG